MTICTLNLAAKAPKKKGYPSLPNSYGDYLKQARLDSGCTRLALSKEFKVYESTIDKWERGVVAPNINNKQKIIKYLGYDPLTN